ncbi:MAG: metal-dependent transcriptional regulator [Intestinibaculum porci]|uniref:DtxR family transcriptional regulator n=2 Tax=Intestinibaculum porci TaxID=2487118 RepID=A0A3G9J1Y2_9FIRM|nr:metal-dependent transcriptional regulator [Intestinibaculum porci]MDD6350435.1 metal-dependent transcriptional regulator [Intestinibaculum porci]MDD6421814.1 metal-dependent transcriptional regulator [Intestinibaculum porci]BBH25190.1 DtxR family transcriptional regulator [Intestinibaculum porci]
MIMSESTEMYLETILVLQNRNGHVRSIDIAHEMNFSKPTISQQMKRLSKQGLITIDDNNYIHLTDEGHRIAAMIFERHNELSQILTYIGVPQDLAADDACRIEHYISQETFDAIKAYFDPLMKKES